MMSTLAILPVKPFTEGKQRLAEALSAGQRRALAEAMFSDVLLALRRAETIKEIAVVTVDRGAQRIAAGHDVRIIEDSEQGHNAAAMRGIADARGDGIERVLLVPGDCPLLAAAELDALLAQADGPEALIVPDRHGTGTNALVLTPPDVIEPAFGPGSRDRHVALARSAGVSHEVIEVPSLALDIDTPEDFAALRLRLDATHGGAAHTRGLITQLTRIGS